MQSYVEVKPIYPRSIQIVFVLVLSILIYSCIVERRRTLYPPLPSPPPGTSYNLSYAPSSAPRGTASSLEVRRLPDQARSTRLVYIPHIG